nr:NAD(P)-dependent oxidoreductase [Haloprofundus halophilus]
MVAVGVVGLGQMGGPIAEHLVAEHSVTAFDLDRSAVERLEAHGATPADTAADAAAGADVVFLSLPTPDVVETVVEEAAEAFDSGSVLVDLSTSTPSTTERVAALLDDRDVDVLGAPVSGGPSGARAGSLSVMVGGDEAVYEACLPLFESFAADVLHVGERPGHGHAVKLLNNYLSFAGFLATSEAVALGRAAGLDGETLVDAFSAGSGRNSATEEKFPNYVLTGEYDMGFPLELMEKDIRLFAEFAEAHDASALLGGVVRNLVGYARVRQGGEADMTRAYEFVEQQMMRR